MFTITKMCHQLALLSSRRPALYARDPGAGIPVKTALDAANKSRHVEVRAN